jgi:hypothetical protein
MSDNCNCETGLGNTGVGGCIEEIKDTIGLIMVNTLDSTGVKTKIDITDVINDAYVTALINESEKKDRWFPLMNLENIATERPQAIFVTSNTGTKKRVKQAVRNFTAEIWTGGIALMNAIAGNRCADLSVYKIDSDGKLVGISNGDGYLYPFKVQSNTFDVRLAENDGQNPEKLLIEFDYDKSVRDETTAYLLTEDDIDLTTIKGLLDITSTVTNITTTSFKIKLTLPDGALNSRKVLSNLLQADFALYNVTDSSAVTISSFAESPEGTYTLGFTAQTSADVIRVTPSKDGYDFSLVVASTVLIP